MSVDDITLAAFADGELSPAEAALIEAEAARDPALAARIERLRELRRAVAGAYAEALAEPPSERLLRAIEAAPRGGGAAVVSLAERQAQRQRRAPMLIAARWGGLAASLVAAFVVGRYAADFVAPAPIAATPSGLVARGDLAVALERQLASTQSAAGPVKIGVSFQALDGRYCRTFMLRRAQPIGGLACRDRNAWRVTMAMQAEPQGVVPGGYRTAGDETPAPILERVDATIRGRPLDAAGEAKARNGGWVAR